METQTDERWYVQFDSKQVQLMTLEELDKAFEDGLIHENTYLIQVGATEWQTLKDVAGLSDEEEEEEEVASEPMNAAPAPAYAAPAPVVAQPAPAPSPVAAAPALQQQQTLRSVAPAAAFEGGWPPVASAPPPSLSQGATMGLPSTIPVVSDLSDVDVSDASSFKSGKKTLAFVAAAAAIAIGGAGYALKQMDAPPPRAAAAAPVQANVGKPTPWVPPAPTTTPEPTPVAAAPSTPSASADSGSSASASSTRLSDDMKKALQIKDDEHAAKKAGKKASGAHAVASRSSGKSGKSKSVNGIHNGGNDNDPLNGKL